MLTEWKECAAVMMAHYYLLPVIVADLTSPIEIS